MSHHKHKTKLKPARKHQSSGLPHNRFGALTGVIDHLTLSPHDGSKPDDNHVYIWIEVASGGSAGKYECAFNTESTDKTSILYAIHEEDVSASEIPLIGFSEAEVSYAGMGLKASDFTAI